MVVVMLAKMAATTMIVSGDGNDICSCGCDDSCENGCYGCGGGNIGNVFHYPALCTVRHNDGT
ncbi:hypothetical protein Ancab_019183 [Ancistrocladus abbreviatus]